MHVPQTNFQGYFQEHETKIRNKQCLLKLLELRLNMLASLSDSRGTKTYNELSINFRKTESFSTYDKLLKKIFS